MEKNIQEILKKVDGLSYNFHIAIKVSRMLDDFNVSIEEISKVIGSDQALTVKLLKHCNSAEFGFSRKIVSIKDAIAVIGFKPLKTMIFTIISKSQFDKEIKGYGLEKGELWQNAISCAVFSRYLANLTKYHDPDQAFTAGLLRDIGKLILHEYVKKEYDEIVNIVNNEQIAFSQAEERVIGLNHTQIGTLVAEKWNFPQILIDVIRYHHDPSSAEEKVTSDLELVKIVHFADYLSVMLGYGIGNDGLLYEVDANVLKELGLNLNSEKMDAIIADIVNQGSEIESLISNLE